MGLLAYWKSDSFERDIKPYGSDLGEWARARGFTFNSKQRTLHRSINEGERLWLVGDRPLPGGGRDFILRACLRVVEKRMNQRTIRASSMARIMCEATTSSRPTSTLMART